MRSYRSRVCLDTEHNLFSADAINAATAVLTESDFFVLDLALHLSNSGVP